MLESVAKINFHPWKDGHNANNTFSYKRTYIIESSTLCDLEWRDTIKPTTLCKGQFYFFLILFHTTPKLKYCICFWGQFDLINNPYPNLIASPRNVIII